ncbi:hypothetical protein GCM10023321_40270 [Pseudonocardia eucalypti]|uniref:Uncharacterized protein n=1 Tax=Pseudonocardia eucalypti TaxID=648755 RepID=A0ABP9Q9X6_9PSEU|nr:hypothetical protein [Pseudonocardia eucalypti]
MNSVQAAARPPQRLSKPPSSRHRATSQPPMVRAVRRRGKQRGPTRATADQRYRSPVPRASAVSISVVSSVG